ncbi:MAG: hypothetical protein ACYC8T_26505, partial [Myxococcaceae bacterium]
MPSIDASDSGGVGVGVKIAPSAGSVEALLGGGVGPEIRSGSARLGKASAERSASPNSSALCQRWATSRASPRSTA